MRPEHVELWERIASFNIDVEPTPSLRFVDRLAKENSWTTEFARRTIEEYRRYVFLCMTAGHHMCPSEQVDQVWHLHLTYTRSYWQRFCGEVLKCPLHHEPTRGGSDEGRKHWAMYSDTLLAYHEAFDEDAPADLWPHANKRFGDDLAIHKYNAKDYWLVRKPGGNGLAVAALLFATLCVIGCGAPGNPFDLVGAEYLPFFLLAWAIAFTVGLLIRRASKGSGLNPEDEAPDLDAYELAYLGGGRPRVLAAAMVRLKEENHVDLYPDGGVVARGAPPADADKVERVVYAELAKQAGSKLNFKPVMKAVQNLEDSRFAKLRDQGLLAAAGTHVKGSLLPSLLCLGTIALVGGSRLIMGLNNHKPVGFLVFCMIVTFIISAATFFRGVRRTRKADDVLARLSQRHKRLRKLSGGLEPGDASLAVAMFGVAVLSGTAYASMYSRMQRFDSTGTGGGCGSTGCSTSGCSGGGGGDGGGGCGGGGCGGCGGGGGD